MATKIKVLSGGAFPEREVNSTTIGALKTELEIPARASVSVKGTGVEDSYTLHDGDLVAAAEKDKGGGYNIVNL